MEGTTLFIWGTVFGVIGLGYFVYGKKQKAVVPLFTGIGLFIIPHLISNVYALIIAGLLLMILPYFARI